MKHSMSTKALASRMAKKTGILKSDCIKLIASMVEEMVVSIKSGEVLHIHNLGKFEYYVRRQTIRFDPIDGTAIVPPATRIKFSPCLDVNMAYKHFHGNPTYPKSRVQIQRGIKKS